MNKILLKRNKGIGNEATRRSLKKNENDDQNIIL